MEDRLDTVQDRDQELLFLRRKLIDLEDHSRRDNIRFFGYPEAIEGSNAKAFLRDTLLKLMGSYLQPPI